ncbi:unnamed protein product [Kluyveromyces dobzhanskii CBS 2104]|uniref:WGS project CCBQ000000000 data, contig 00041 n=1 Tax=Kluyveromyces dobzhanskii CBS 2104 TaxID=1427455 RepID=A0A0A8L2J9_9SACH|nr:unnamed protein product [Kluyveromyces dobzhanskii CBS 2104]
MTVEIVSQWKSWLLKYKAGSSITNDEINELVSCFKDVSRNLADSGINEKQRVQSVDVMSMLMLKVYQILRKLKNDNKQSCSEFEVIVRDKMFSVEQGTFLFHYVIDFWTDTTVSMEIPLRNMFERLLQLMNYLYGTDMMQNILYGWVETVLSLQENMKVQYYLLDVFSNQIDLYMILQLKPNFVKTCLSLVWAETLCTQVGKCLSTVLLNWYKYHFDESTIEDWLLLWKPLCCSYLNDPKYTKRIQFYVLSLIFRQLPASFGFFIKEHEEFSSTLLLSIFKIGQELAIEEEPFHEEKYIKTEDVISLLQQDQYKLPTFELLTYSNKRSKKIQPYIYDIIKDNLTIFFVDYKLQTRNYFHGSLKLFINRIRDSAYSLNRDAHKLKQKNKFPEEQLFKLQQVKYAYEFMKWLVKFLKSQMTPGSQYQRRSLAYQIFSTLLISGLDSSIPTEFLDSKQRMDYPFSIELFDTTMVRILVDDLTNDYDDIREHSLKLLSIAFESTNGVGLNVDETSLFDLASQLLLSYKSSDGGAKILEFVFTISDRKMDHLSKLLVLLQKLLKNASCDLIGNISFPVSGIFTALALVSKKIDNKEFTEQLSQSLIDSTILNWQTVKEIVCHDSPEGNLPIQYMNCGISDQVITSYAFRSIKESSMLLKTLLAYKPLSSNQIEKCGSLLLEQLSSIRHSGAFQSVFPTYVELCECAQRTFPDVLQKWLETSVFSLRTKSQYITRRSGGLPFMISAILSSETAPDRPWLKWTFDHLFEIATIPILQHEEKLDLPQVHAFNCIKGIFNESKLSSFSSPYVQSTLELCLKNFTSPVWTLRNCCVMLFTALQNRLFGKAGRTMSARLFFTRFKGIREVLLESLKNSINSAALIPNIRESSENFEPEREENANIESIFLVFTILGRLKPTLMYDGLDEFESEIIKGLECPNWKIRELAARTFASSVQDPKKRILELLGHLVGDSRCQNRMHGYLLAVKEAIGIQLLDTPNVSLNEISFLLINYYQNFLPAMPCYATAKLYSEIVEQLLTSGSVTDNEKRKFLNILGNTFIKENSSYVVNGSLQLFLAVVTRILLKFEDIENLTDIAELALRSEFFEVQLSALHCLKNLYVSQERLPILSDTLIEILHDPNQWVAVKADALTVLRLAKIKVKSFKYSDVTSDKSEILQSSVLENMSIFENVPEAVFWELIGTYGADENPDHLRVAATRCLMNFYLAAPNNDEVLFRIYQQLFDDSLDVRVMAARFFNENVFHTKASDLESSPYSTSLRCVRQLPETFDKDKICPILLNFLENLYHGLAIGKTDPAEANELFDIEKDNQYRNELQLGSQIIEMLKAFNNPLISIQVKETKQCLTDIVTDIGSKNNDAVANWGTNPEIFNKLSLQRKFIASFGEDLTEIDKNLKLHNYHPLLFDI